MHYTKIWRWTSYSNNSGGGSGNILDQVARHIFTGFSSPHAAVTKHTIVHYTFSAADVRNIKSVNLYASSARDLRAGSLRLYFE